MLEDRHRALTPREVADQLDSLDLVPTHHTHPPVDLHQHITEHHTHHLELTTGTMSTAHPIAMNTILTEETITVVNMNDMIPAITRWDAPQSLHPWVAQTPENLATSGIVRQQHVATTPMLREPVLMTADAIAPISLRHQHPATDMLEVHLVFLHTLRFLPNHTMPLTVQHSLKPTFTNNLSTLKLLTQLMLRTTHNSSKPMQDRITLLTLTAPILRILQQRRTMEPRVGI